MHKLSTPVRNRRRHRPVRAEPPRRLRRGPDRLCRPAGLGERGSDGRIAVGNDLPAAARVLRGAARCHDPAPLKPGSPRSRPGCRILLRALRSEEHTSELQSLMRNSYAVFCLKKKTKKKLHTNTFSK